MTGQVIVALAVAALLVAVLGGTVIAVAGTGTGSVLMALLSLPFGFQVAQAAVAAVALPYLAATVAGAVQPRKEIDRPCLMRFGIVCAVTSLVGALLLFR